MKKLLQLSVLVLAGAISMFSYLPGHAQVNEFTGSFQYGIPIITVPGPDGSTYSMTLQYQSNNSPNTEASWVGFGWTLDPGAIVRNVKGYPDDWKDPIISWNKVERNWTVTAAYKVNLETMSNDYVFGNDTNARSKLNFKYYTRYNNNIGYWQGYALGVDIFGLTNLDYSWDQRDGASFSAGVSPALFLKALDAGLGTPSNDWVKTISLLGTYGSASVANSFIADALREHNPPSVNMVPYTGESKDYSAAFLLSLPGILSGVEFGVEGNYTYQDAVPRREIKAYGYMYSGDAPQDENALMDYYTEKDNTYFKTCKFLAVPFSSYDDYIVTNVGGTFRMYNKRSGHFRPNKIESKLDIDNIGLELHGGIDRFGLGGQFGDGKSTYKVSRWEDATGVVSSYVFAKKDGTTDEPYFFRTLNDLGGSVYYSADDNAFQAGRDMDEDNDISLSNVSSVMNGGLRSGRNTYIGYNTNHEMMQKYNGGSVYYKAYNKSTDSRNFVNRSDATLQNKIGEIAVVSSNGGRMVYGLPVHSRREKSLLFGLTGLTLDAELAKKVLSKHLAFENKTTGLADIIIGEEKDNPYAVSFLLTEVTTPDYIDRTNDGPTADDYGGYVKFNYRRSAGAYNKSGSDSSRYWFKRRFPYNGMFFNPNDLSDPKDDIGSMTVSESELYYLESIETKTHIAYFVTNKTHLSATFGENTVSIDGPNAERLDGYEAEFYDWRATGDSSASGIYVSDNENDVHGIYSTSDKNPNHLEYLDRVELYLKDGNGIPLQTTRFGYDYSLMSDQNEVVTDTVGFGSFEKVPAGLPNSALIKKDCTPIIVSGEDAEICSLYRAGKLTLKQVWFEYGGIKNARISPYQFVYSYKPESEFPAVVTTKYSDITAYGDRWTAAQQNPVYSPFNIDRWGQYQFDGATRYDRYQVWNTQNPADEFDPAAYCLKQIILPSGGEMHIQYEANDYSYVQDRDAMAMVSLVANRASGKNSSDSDNDNKYYLNITDLHIDSTQHDIVDKLRSKIQEMVSSEEKMYFKLLYALKGDAASIEHPEYNSQYITGYARVAEVGIETINPGPSEWYAVYVRLKEAEGDYNVPKDVCLDFVKKNKRGKLSPSEGVAYTDNGVGMIVQLLGKAWSGESKFFEGNHCKSIDYANSYVRVPIVFSKLGGGVRVKRLLTYDAGAEAGYESLYGTEYTYETFDEKRKEYISSGVASNEPAVGREENALVRFMSESAADEVKKKVVAGIDIQQFVGPLGEGLLPRAMIGYSRIVKNNIHTGATQPGFAVQEYFTTKDYPLSVSFTGKFDEPVSSTTLLNLGYGGIVAGAINSSTDIRDLTQGYSFVLNSMNGSPKRLSTFGGEYASPNSWFLTSQSEYEYFTPGQKVPLIDNIATNDTSSGFLGREMDVVFESRAVYDYNKRLSTEGDISFPFPFPSWPMAYKGSVQLQERINQLRSHVSSKTVQYPTLVKKVRTFADGVYHTTENVAFQAKTGAPVITRTYDGYNEQDLASSSDHKGVYTSFAFPAFKEYPGMSQKALNEQAVIASGADASLPRILLNGTSPEYSLLYKIGTNNSLPENSCERYKAQLEQLRVGDLIEVSYPDATKVGLFHIAGKAGSTINLIAVSSVLGGAAFSSTVTDQPVNIQVIRSGNSNQIATAAGSLATYGDDRPLWKQVGGTGQAGIKVNLASLLNIYSNMEGPQYITSYALPALEYPDEPGVCSVLREDNVIVVNRSPDGKYLTIALLPFVGSEDSLCSVTLNREDYMLFKAERDGSIIYTSSCGGHSITLPCPFLCRSGYTVSTMKKVISASAMTFTDAPSYADTESFAAPLSDANEFESGQRGIWKSKANYVYQALRVAKDQSGTVTSQPDAAGYRTYNSGIFKEFSLFNWQHEWINYLKSDNTAAYPSQWVRTDSVTQYSRNGGALESFNILDIPSAVDIGYAHTLPRFQVQNNEYAGAVFESFEEGSYSTAAAHSGKHSLEIPVLMSPYHNITGQLTPRILEKGLLLRFWVKVQDYSVDIPVEPELFVSNNSTTIVKSFDEVKKIARTGEWTLYEATISNVGGPIIAPDSYRINLLNNTDETVWVDDVRVHQPEAEMTGFVYDNDTRRLVATLDRDNFALYNQYNAEGMLLRTRVETAKGVKTVVDGIAHLPSIARDENEGIPGVGGMPSGISSRYVREASTPNSTQWQFEQLSPLGTGGSGKVDLLDIHLSPDKMNVQMLGRDSLNLPDNDAVVPKHNTPKPDELLPNSSNSLLENNLPVPENNGVLSTARKPALDALNTQLIAIDKQKQQIKQQQADELSPEAKAGLEKQLELLEARERQLQEARKQLVGEQK